MNLCKEIQSKFWQNTFVLELSPEERYFYMYLITNTMTTTCGIYKFNMKLAELETGLHIDAINKYLNFFEQCGKIMLSSSTKEIMLVNWFKHNFKSNKKTISCINKELKEVKDKDFLRQLYEICRERQYPVDELFNGVTLPAVEKEEDKDVVQATQEVLQEQEDVIISEEETKELVETSPVLFAGFNIASKGRKGRKRKVKAEEEILEVEEMDIVPEEGIWLPVKGNTIASWAFGGG